MTRAVIENAWANQECSLAAAPIRHKQGQARIRVSALFLDTIDHSCVSGVRGRSVLAAWECAPGHVRGKYLFEVPAKPAGKH